MPLILVRRAALGIGWGFGLALLLGSMKGMLLLAIAKNEAGASEMAGTSSSLSQIASGSSSMIGPAGGPNKKKPPGQNPN